MLVNTVIIGSVLATAVSATVSNQAIGGLVQRNECPPPVTVTVTVCEPGTNPTPAVPGEGGVVVPPGTGNPDKGHPGEGNPPGPGGQVTQVPPPGDQGSQVPGDHTSPPPGGQGTQTPGVPGEVVPSNSPSAEHIPSTSATPATGAPPTTSQMPSGSHGTSTTSPTLTTAGASGSRLTTLGSIFAGAATLFAALALY